MGLGDRYKAHVDFFVSQGYTETKEIIDETFEPASTADKSFTFQWILKGQQKETGHHEVTRVTFELKVIYSKGQNKAYSDFYKEMWNEVDTLEKAYIQWGDNTAGKDRVFIEAITPQPLDQNFELVVFTGFNQFLRSLI